ncbi:hypothetical protein [Amycolatopsis pigmentata]|uniref:Glycosyltransferase RgtA/B/C/D-like domain-containing protein n=1 Tax=Amycolatopsis pigmentata TaxID=450801 RepID=A0ABW5FTR8_9PSEU
MLALALVEQLLFGTMGESAFVTFRYAENIAAGHGAVFDLGEPAVAPANFAWLVVVTLLKAMFGLDVAASAMVLSIVCVLGCVVLSHRLGGPFGPLAAVLTTAAAVPAACRLTGTEMGLFVLLLLAVASALAGGHTVVAGVLAALALMTRPEGAIPAVLAGIWLAVGAVKRRWSWWAPLGYLLGGFVFVAPWFTWRALSPDRPLSAAAAVACGPATYGFLGVTLLSVGSAVLLARRRSAPRPAPRAVTGIVLAVCTLSLTISAAAWSGVTHRRARTEEAKEIGSWLAEWLPPGSVIDARGNAALAYAAGPRLVVADDPAVTRPALVAYTPARDCAGLPGPYESATFQRVATGAWITVYPREDVFGSILGRLTADPRLTYAPCPRP